MTRPNQTKPNQAKPCQAKPQTKQAIKQTNKETAEKSWDLSFHSPQFLIRSILAMAKYVLNIILC